MNGQRMVNATECASLLRITTGSLYKMAREGLVPCYRVGQQQRSLRFDLDEVREALKQEVEEED